MIFALVIVLALIHPHDCHVSAAPEFHPDADSLIGIEADGVRVKTTCVF